jgi:hypothetical protein
MFIADTMPHPLTQIEIVHRLKEVGFTQEQAETQAQIITEVNDNSLTTKQDLEVLEKDLKQEISELRQEMRSEFVLVRNEISLLRNEFGNEITLLRNETKSEFVLVRKEMELIKSDILIKMTAITTAIMSTLLTLFGALHKLFGF